MKSIKLILFSSMNLKAIYEKYPADLSKIINLKEFAEKDQADFSKGIKSESFQL
jgi:hypothetical protein